MQTDPAGYDAGMNLYAYVGNDPANNIDPSGMDPCNPGDFDFDIDNCGGPETIRDTGIRTYSCPNFQCVSFSPSQYLSLGKPTLPATPAQQGGTNSHFCAVQPTQPDDFRAAGDAAIRMTSQFFFGTGPSDLTYGTNSAVSREMAQSGGVNSALRLYNSQNQLNGVYVFGAHGYFTEGANPVSQFVGSFTWSVADARGGINLSLSNYSSVSSLTDHILASHNRPGAMGTTHQTYNIYVPCH